MLVRTSYDAKPVIGSSAADALHAGLQDSSVAATELRHGQVAPLLSPHPSRNHSTFRYNPNMSRLTMSQRRVLTVLLFLCGVAPILSLSTPAQQAPHPSGARILLLPHKMVSGEHSTLAVLDVNGRLTPGVHVNFSNGDRVTTDTTGRALFVAPLNPGVISAVLAGHPGRVYTTILSPMDASSPSIEISAAPRLASLTDRFELSGRSFCGDADANKVTVAGQPALVLASSPTSLVVLPPSDLGPGDASVVIACNKQDSQSFVIRFVELSLEADSSPLKAGDHRTLTVHVRGTASKVGLEAHNLAPDIAELTGGNPARLATTGGTQNTARFELTGKQHGNFVVSIRLLPTQSPPRP